MELIPVESSNLDRVGYDTDTKTLRVLFKNGRTYDYTGVPAVMFGQLLAAESVGKFLNGSIKPHYAVTEVKADG
jgi:hypothetical protein